MAIFDKNKVFVIDFTNLNTNFNQTKPIGFYFNLEFHTSDSWQNLYKELVGLFIDFNKINHFMEKSNYISNTFIISKSPEKMIFPKKVFSEYFLECGISNNDIVRNLKKLLEVLDFDINKIHISYVINDDGKTSFNEDQLIQDITCILEHNFPNGVQLNYLIERKIKKLYKDLKGIDIPNCFDLEKAIRMQGININNKVYVISKENKKILFDYITNIFSQGNSIISYNVIFSKKYNELCKMNIPEVNVLKLLLKEMFPIYEFYDTYFSSISNLKLEDAIFEKFKDRLKISSKEIMESFPYVDFSDDDLSSYLDDRFIKNDKYSYLILNNVLLSEKDVNNSIFIIETELKKNLCCAFNKISINESEKLNYEDIDDSTLRLVLYKRFLINRYIKRGNFLTNTNVSFNKTKLIKDYCLSHDYVTLTELKNYEYSITKSSSSSRALNIANEYMYRASQNEFILYDRTKFDIESIDKVLSTFVDNSVISIQSVNSFFFFPDIEGLTWNSFSLASYCAKVSSQFSAMFPCLEKDIVGAIYPKSMQFDSYEELLAYVLIENNYVNNEKGEIVMFLNNKGFVKSLPNLEKIFSSIQKYELKHSRGT